MDASLKNGAIGYPLAVVFVPINNGVDKHVCSKFPARNDVASRGTWIGCWDEKIKNVSCISFTESKPWVKFPWQICDVCDHVSRQIPPKKSSEFRNKSWNFQRQLLLNRPDPSEEIFGSARTWAAPARYDFKAVDSKIELSKVHLL